VDVNCSTLLILSDADSFLDISRCFNDSRKQSPVVNLSKKSMKSLKHWDHKNMSLTVHQNTGVVYVPEEKIAMNEKEP
jgi:hypothetical protein